MRGLLGGDVQIVHAVHASPEDIAALAATGARVSLSPITELRTMGFPLVSELLAAGVAVTRSTDTLAMPTAPDVLATLRAVEAVETSRTGSGAVTPRGLPGMATLDGAHDLGLGEVTGAIRPGKRADLLPLDATVANLLPNGDPLEALVRQGHAGNIHPVVIDGRILLDGGRLTQPKHSRVSRRRDVHRWIRFRALLNHRIWTG
jgi:5-methylthioadenosine/S-adenosylhomocysteine deaminase